MNKPTGKRQPVRAIQALCDPFESCCWQDITTPITREEVMAAVVGKLPNLTHQKSRRRHIKKIATFYISGWQDPLEIDVGVPALQCHVAWPLQDGNHRFAAAILRKHHHVHAEISGDIQFAKELGLNP